MGGGDVPIPHYCNVRAMGIDLVVYKLIMANSIEQKVFQMQQDKQALVDALFTEKSMSFTQFDEQQMLSLIKS